MPTSVQSKDFRKIGLVGGIGGAGTGVATALWQTEVISAAAFALIILIPLALLVAVAVSLRSRPEEARLKGPLWRYYRDFWIATTLYMIGMSIAIAIWNEAQLSPAMAFGIALLPVIPTWAMIYVMGRYIGEETDEFLRHRAIMSSLIGLGAVLVLGSLWGFMEMFGVVPNIWAWWVVPAWAIGMGFGQAILSREDDRQGDV